MKNKIIGAFIGAFLAFILIVNAENERYEKIKRKMFMNRVENATPKTVIENSKPQIKKISTIFYPSGEYGTRGGIKNPTEWDEKILIAAFLNTECRNCILKEKKLILEALRNRVENNYDGFGATYYEQIFARRYDKKNERWQIQFSGVGKPNALGKYFFYHRDDKASVDNYRAVWEIIVEGERTLPCDVTDFLFPAASTDSIEVKRQARNRYMPYDGFYKGMYHRLASCRKITCEIP